MNKFFLSFFLPLMAAVFAFTACSESDGVEEEYVDWQATNETYFDNLYTRTKEPFNFLPYSSLLTKLNPKLTDSVTTFNCSVRHSYSRKFPLIMISTITIIYNSHGVRLYDFIPCISATPGKHYSLKSLR